MSDMKKRLGKIGVSLDLVAELAGVCPIWLDNALEANAAIPSRVLAISELICAASKMGRMKARAILAADDWRSVPGFPTYEASAQGSVRRVLPDGRRTILRQHLRTDGYLRVTLWLNGRRLHRHVHRLVCLAFHGEPADCMMACHKNGFRTDNCQGNLYWGTPAENYADQVRHGTAVIRPLGKRERARRERSRQRKNWQESGNGIRIRSKTDPIPSLNQIRKAKKNKMMENVRRRASQ